MSSSGIGFGKGEWTITESRSPFHDVRGALLHLLTEPEMMPQGMEMDPVQLEIRNRGSAAQEFSALAEILSVKQLSAVGTNSVRKLRLGMLT